MDEDVKLIEKQGIVSILGADCDRAKSASLRRTLSADMSSKKWLAQHGFSHMKKIASSQQFTVSAADSLSSSSEGEDEYEEGKEADRPGMFQTWSSILSQKGCEEPGKSGSHSLPYVHPLVKRSSSSLSEKSLQICTESLGSETGSDGFSSSATNDDEEDQHPQHQQQQDDSIHLGKQKLAVVERPDFYSSVRKRLQPQPPSSFPPPLPSLSSSQGPNVRIHSHRRNGRLVLEAVSVSSQNYFQAQRHDGRLVLTFASPPFNHDGVSDKEPDDDEEEGEEGEELERELENFEGNEIQMDEDEDVEAAYVLKVGKENEFNQETLAVANLPSGVMNMQRSSALMMKKLMGLVNRNPTWPPKHKKAADLQEAAPLPPPPRVPRIITTSPATTAASSFNPYEYYWRSMGPTATAVLNPPPSIPLKNNSDKFILSKSSKAQEQQQLLLLRGNKAEYSVPLLRGCKEPRRSLVIWEPYCIATS